GERRPGEHHVPPGAPDHAVAVAHRLGRLALGPRGPHGHLEARSGPQLGYLGDVQLRAAGLHVVEVAPGEHVDAADARRCSQISDLGDGIREVVHGVAHSVGPPHVPGAAHAGRACLACGLPAPDRSYATDSRACAPRQGEVRPDPDRRRLWPRPRTISTPRWTAWRDGSVPTRSPAWRPGPPTSRPAGASWRSAASGDGR